jgi:opacity protein-like surface antigen
MIAARWVFASIITMSMLALIIPADRAQAEEWKAESGGTEAGKIILGMRAGFAPVTQTVTPGTSTDVGSLVNFEGLYSLNKWLLVGMMVEWERHSMSTVGPSVDLGHQDTVSVLPTVEIRPVRFGPLTPYANMSFGVNVNSFGESSAIGGTQISPSNNFAWRVGWGLDYMVTQRFALNTEMAYKRNDGTATVTAPGGAQTTVDWNATSFGFLFGVKMFF